MDNPLTIFVAEFVPLRNKGEEAIIRGIEDMLSDGRPVRLAVLGPEKQPTDYGNIRVFPIEWVYPVMGRRLGAKRAVAVLAWQSAKQLLGMSGLLGNLAKSRDPRHAEMVEFFRSADYVIVGHDGVFSPESCSVIHLARKCGKRVGILGAGISSPASISLLTTPLYRRAVDESHFCELRERNAYEYMKSIGCDPEKMSLGPDPAFAMKPVPAKDVQDYLSRQDWYVRARQQGKLVIASTVCQKAILMRRAFSKGATLKERHELHTKFLSEVFDRVIRERSAFVVYLPHSIEEGERDDLKAARDLVGMLQASWDHYHVMTDDLPVRMFKGIIRESDFLIGQRAHSLIGSAAVETPFVALTASNDRRTHDILGDMCDCERQMVDMDKHTAQSAAAEILSAIDRRQEIRSHLQGVMVELRRRLAEIALLVRGQG